MVLARLELRSVEAELGNGGDWGPAHTEMGVSLGHLWCIFFQCGVDAPGHSCRIPLFLGLEEETILHKNRLDGGLGTLEVMLQPWEDGHPPVTLCLCVTKCRR